MSSIQAMNRRRLAIFGIAIIAIVVTILAIVYMRGDDETSIEGDALKTAEALTAEGSYDQALEKLQQAENTDMTTPERVALLNELAAAAANAGQIEQAIEYYSQKHELDSGSRATDGYLVGELYERSGNIPKTIEHFKLYLDYLKAQPADEFTDATIASLAERLRELEEGQ